MSEQKLQDEDYQLDTSDQKTSTIPEKRRKKPDHVDATPTPPTLTSKYEEQEAYEGTPSETNSPMTVADDAERYDMGHVKRGTCLVFNHEVFEGGIPTRPGSKFDVIQIDATFSRLGFDVVIHDNLGHREIMDKIESCRIDDHANNDCLCVFVLTHGESGNLLRARDTTYCSENIWKPFTADTCSSLAGKPKLFFFQACRGEDSDKGVRVMSRSNDDNQMQIDHVPNSYTIPTHADFLISHSCVDGFYSWRCPEEGTWYVQTLCKVLNEFAESTDLPQMLTMMARRVAFDFQSYHDLPELNARKQMPSITSTLIRDLYFTPK